jgi:flavin-dependent dehydrogenase
MIESVDCVVVGAGPAGLRAAELLGTAGRDVVVLERNGAVGPKTCAGGLTPRAVRTITAWGGPGPGPRRTEVPHISFRGEPLVPLDAEMTTLQTVARRDLGQWQLARAVRAGVDVRTNATASQFDLPARTLRVAGRTIRYRNLIGADGSTSTVRRALGLPSPRAFFACEFNIPLETTRPLHVAADAPRLANGYWWLFPHAGYVSLGAGAPKHLVPPAALRQEVERHAVDCGISLEGLVFEGATLEVAHFGCHFRDGVHLVGDAAGLPSPLTGEGIYPALVSGESVAHAILEEGAPPTPALRAWLQVKRLHAALMAVSSRQRAREAILMLCAALARAHVGRRWLASLFIGR